jgi:hypothetical protein
MIEFTLAVLPLLIMVYVLMDVAWGMFAKSTLAYAVRSGLRVGITTTGTTASTAGPGNTALSLTTMVKQNVQANAFGLLAGTSGLANIQVHYFHPPDVGSGAAPTDVSAVNPLLPATPGDIMQVSVQGFSLRPLVGRIFGLRSGVDSASTPLAAVASDLIEPSRDPPVKGTAP